MFKADMETLVLLKRGQELLKEWRSELAEPACYKRFQQNVQLLLGARNMTITALAKETHRDKGDLSKLIGGKNKIRFERAQLELFEDFGRALGVNAHTLLFVDLKKALLDLIKEIENA